MIWACPYYTDFMDGWFCESYSPFHVCLTIRLSAQLVYATSHLSFDAFYSYLVSWLTMIWACTYYTNFTLMVKETWKGLLLLQKSTIREIGIICACSDHGQSRYQAHIMPISRMVDFCESYSPFHVCLTIRPSAHLVYTTSHLSFVAFYYSLANEVAKGYSNDVWSNKHEKGYNSCKNQPSVKSV
jgi:hypothetical protein